VQRYGIFRIHHIEKLLQGYGLFYTFNKILVFAHLRLQTRATPMTIKANSGENMSKIKACLAKNTVTLQPTNYKEQ